MKGPLALVGVDEFRPGCEELDRAVLDAAGADKPVVLVLPTASANQGPQMAAANGVRYFSELGAEAAALMVLEPEHANDGGLISAVESAQAVYIAGGDPMHLLAVLKGSLLLDKLIDANRRGMAITGSSAGAMVMAAWMRYRDWTLALGLVPNVTVLPHHERSEPEQVNGAARRRHARRHGRSWHRCADRMRLRCGQLDGVGTRAGHGLFIGQLDALRLRRDLHTVRACLMSTTKGAFASHLSLDGRGFRWVQTGYIGNR